MRKRKMVRRLRHWKQRFNKDAEFIFQRPLTYCGVAYEPGDAIPETLALNKTKLRRFWESHTIQLAEFEAPNVATGQVEDDSWLDGDKDADKADDGNPDESPDEKPKSFLGGLVDKITGKSEDEDDGEKSEDEDNEL